MQEPSESRQPSELRWSPPWPRMCRNPPARSQLPISWRHHRSRGALRHLLFSVLKTSATLIQCPCLAWGGGSASAAEVGGQGLPRGDRVVTGLGPEAARAPALGVTIPAGREQAAEPCEERSESLCGAGDGAGHGKGDLAPSEEGARAGARWAATPPACLWEQWLPWAQSLPLLPSS